MRGAALKLKWRSYKANRFFLNSIFFNMRRHAIAIASFLVGTFISNIFASQETKQPFASTD